MKYFALGSLTIASPATMYYILISDTTMSVLSYSLMLMAFGIYVLSSENKSQNPGDTS